MPSPHAHAIHHTELADTYIEHWTEHTPADDYRRSLEQLTEAILPFNHNQIEDNRRITLLDLYTDLLNELAHQHDDEKLQRLGLHQGEIKKSQTNITRLYTSLASGYQIIIKNRLDDKKSSLKKEIFKLALYRAMALNHAAILHTLNTQQTRPALSYLNIHQLYRLAEKQKVDTDRIRQIKSETNAPTIIALYKHILLFTLATSNNTAIEHKKVAACFSVLEPFSDDCQIIPGAVCFAPSGHAVIDLSSDQTPIACSHCGLAARPSQDPITLNILPAVKAIRKRIAKLRTRNINAVDAEESVTLQQLTADLVHLWQTHDNHT